LKVIGYGSPLTVILGNATDEAISFAASVCARYSDGKKMPEVDVSVKRNSHKLIIKASPANDEILDDHRIEKKKIQKVLM
jgi:hypothetical protein